jgi:hypothetical protein
MVAVPKVKVSISGSLEIEAMIDSGAEVNIISRRAADAAGLPIQTQVRLGIKSVSGEVLPLDGICENVAVDIRGITNFQTLMVFDGSGHDLILGCPFIRQAQATFYYTDDGAQHLKVRNSTRTKEGCVRIKQSEDPREAVVSENE